MHLIATEFVGRVSLKLSHVYVLESFWLRNELLVYFSFYQKRSSFSKIEKQQNAHSAKTLMCNVMRDVQIEKRVGQV